MVKVNYFGNEANKTPNSIKNVFYDRSKKEAKLIVEKILNKEIPLEQIRELNKKEELDTQFKAEELYKIRTAHKALWVTNKK